MLQIILQNGLRRGSPTYERRARQKATRSKEARASAGEWYHWFTARMAIHNWPGTYGADYGACTPSFSVPPPVGGVLSGDPLDFWERDGAVPRTRMPIIAEDAKSNQFLAVKHLVLNTASRDTFLDCVTRDFFGCPGAARPARSW
jgi:hypothetical protein